MAKRLPVGKLPADLLGRLLGKIELSDKSIVIGPGIGRDVAVMRSGKKLLVAKTDPVTLAADLIGWYAVNVNANDIATMGVRPRWFLATVLLPEKCTDRMAEAIFDQIHDACRSLGISLVGGHAEISYGLVRPIVVGCMLAEEADVPVITSAGAKVGDDIVLTKGIAIEGTALLAREAGAKLRDAGVRKKVIASAAEFLFKPGISVLKEALIARASAEVHAMHDPTEGGLATGLYEIAEAAQVGVLIEEDMVPVVPESREICDAISLNPLGLLASGSLIITLPPQDTLGLLSALSKESISAAVIGRVVPVEEGVKIRSRDRVRNMPKFKRDELARFLEGVEE